MHRFTNTNSRITNNSDFGLTELSPILPPLIPVNMSIANTTSSTSTNNRTTQATTTTTTTTKITTTNIISTIGSGTTPTTPSSDIEIETMTSRITTTSTTTRSSTPATTVGLLGLARSLQKDLDRIAETADTSKKEGLTYILTETTLAILRHPDYCISAHSSVDLKSDMDDVEKLFNRLSIEERGNLDEETLVNVDNIKRQSTSSKGSTGFNNEYIVITILVAAEGEYKLPTISSIEDLKEALKMLGSILAKKTLAVEVLWTPQDENDTLTEQEMLENYPLLRLYK